MITLVRRPRPNPYEVADALQRVDRHIDEFTVSLRRCIHTTPRPVRAVHDAYRDLATIAVVLQPLKQALRQYDELEAPLSSKELGLRAVQLVVLELAPTIVALAKDEDQLSGTNAGFASKLQGLRQDIKRIARIWTPYRRTVGAGLFAQSQEQQCRAATDTAWDAWKRLRANRARDTALRVALTQAKSPTIRRACSAILKVLYTTSFDTKDEDVRAIIECVLMGNVRWQ